MIDKKWISDDLYNVLFCCKTCNYDRAGKVNNCAFMDQSIKSVYGSNWAVINKTLCTPSPVDGHIIIMNILYSIYLQYLFCSYVSNPSDFNTAENDKSKRMRLIRFQDYWKSFFRYFFWKILNKFKPFFSL